MKINRGKEILTTTSLVIANDDEEITLMDELTVIKVTTDNTDFEKVIEGFFGYVDETTICVGDEKIPMEYIEEIEIIR